MSGDRCTVREVAAELGIDRARVHVMCRKGILVGVERVPDMFKPGGYYYMVKRGPSGRFQVRQFRRGRRMGYADKVELVSDVGSLGEVKAEVYPDPTNESGSVE
jgi:hypothetical protein